MPSYSPIDIGQALQASRSDLVSFKWSVNGITADFILPDDDVHGVSARALRISA